MRSPLPDLPDTRRRMTEGPGEPGRSSSGVDRDDLSRFGIDRASVKEALDEHNKKPPEVAREAFGRRCASCEDRPPGRGDLASAREVPRSTIARARELARETARWSAPRWSLHGALTAIKEEE